jgi:hypothetical protein
MRAVPRGLPCILGAGVLGDVNTVLPGNIIPIPPPRPLLCKTGLAEDHDFVVINFSSHSAHSPATNSPSVRWAWEPGMPIQKTLMLLLSPILRCFVPEFPLHTSYMLLLVWLSTLCRRRLESRRNHISLASNGGSPRHVRLSRVGRIAFRFRPLERDSFEVLRRSKQSSSMSIHPCFVNCLHVHF